MKTFIFSLSMLNTLVVLCQGQGRCSNDDDCLHGGTCQTNSFRCKCQPSYFGVKCENKNECHPKCPDQKMCIKKDNENVCEDINSSKLADIVFALDSSQSLNKSEFETMVNAVKDFVNKHDFGSDKAHFGAFAFNDSVSKRNIKLNEFRDKNSFLAELMKFKEDLPRGEIRIDRALNYLQNYMFTVNNGDRDKAPNIALIFSVGQSKQSRLTKSAALKIKDTDINVLCIGIGATVDLEELQFIATRKDDVFLTNFTMLSGLVDTLVNKTCNVSADICYSNPCKNGGSCRKFLTEYICDCPQSYLGINCEIKCDISGDIMVVIDESGKISEEDFNKIIDGVESFIKKIDIANGKVRLGVITYASQVIGHFNLDDFDNKLDMLFVCNLLRRRRRGGRSFAHKALGYLRRFSFTAQKGDRYKYPNVVLFFTHTTSDYLWITGRYARTLHESGVSIYAIGIGPKVTRSGLSYIASKPQRHHMILTSFIRLELAITFVVAESCEDLSSLKPCMNCAYDSECIPGMICCGGCCQDTVTKLG